MRLLAAGDNAALSTLVDRWQRPLLSFTYRYVQDRETAHELTQETFVNVYRNAQRYKPEQKFSSWIFKIASNLCKNHFRWRSRHPEHSLYELIDDEARVPGELTAGTDPAGAAETADEAARVAAAVASMPHGMKVALLLHYYDGQSYREIASVIGCSERGVETRLYRARAALAERLRLATGSCEDANGKRRALLL